MKRTTFSVAILLMLLVASFPRDVDSAQAVFCSSRRIAAGDSQHIRQPKTENDGLGGSLVYTQADLPWLVVPQLTVTLPATPEPKQVGLQELALSQPWIEELLFEHETLVEYELPKIEIGALYSQPSKCKKASSPDSVSFHWHDTVFSRAFAEYPVQCASAQPQEFGIDPQSGRASQWGQAPRSVRDGSIFVPSGGTEAMESIVSRINKSRLMHAPLIVHYASNDYYPLQAITYRSCISVDTAALLAAVHRQLGLRDVSAAIAPASGHGIGAHSAAALTVSTPTLFPVRECVEQEGSGTCVARFGYVLLGTDGPLDVPVDDTHRNFFEPSDVAKRVALPTRFEPGMHRNVFKVKWFCVGKKFGQWNDISWTLMGSRTTVTKNVDRCGDQLQSSDDPGMSYANQVQNKYRSLLSLESKGESSLPPPAPLPPRFSYDRMNGLACERREIIAGVQSDEINPKLSWTLRALPEVLLRLDRCQPGDYIRIELRLDAELALSRTSFQNVLSEKLSFRCAKQLDASGKPVDQPLLSFALDPLAASSELPGWPLSGAFPIDGRAYRPPSWNSEAKLPTLTKRMRLTTRVLYAEHDTEVLDAEVVTAVCTPSGGSSAVHIASASAAGKRQDLVARHEHEDHSNNGHDDSDNGSHHDDDDDDGDDHVDCGDDIAGCGNNRECSDNHTMLCYVDNHDTGHGHTICKPEGDCQDNWDRGHHRGECHGTRPPCTNDTLLVCCRGQERCIDSRDLTRRLGQGCGLGGCPVVSSSGTPSPPHPPMCNVIEPVCDPKRKPPKPCPAGKVAMCQTSAGDARQHDQCVDESAVNSKLAAGFTRGICNCTAFCTGGKVLMCDRDCDRCHNECVEPEAVHAMLAHGDTLGACNSTSGGGSGTTTTASEATTSATASATAAATSDAATTASSSASSSSGTSASAATATAAGATSASSTVTTAVTTAAVTTTGSTTSGSTSATSTEAVTTAASSTTVVTASTAASATSDAAASASTAGATASSIASTTTGAASTTAASATAAYAASTAASTTTATSSAAIAAAVATTSAASTTAAVSTTLGATSTAAAASTTGHPAASSSSSSSVPPTTTAASSTTGHTTPPPHQDCDGDDQDRCEIVPFVQCTRNLENGTCLTTFGYNNHADDTVFRAAGVATGNYFAPSPSVRLGQPSTFYPGRHENVFTVAWPCPRSQWTPVQTLAWILNGSAAASSSTHDTCEDEDGQCPDTATMQLYRDSEFKRPFVPDNEWDPEILEGDTVYSLLTLDVASFDLDDFCARVDFVQMCAVQDEDEVEPFDPRHPGSTGCNTPGIEPIVSITLYNRKANYSNGAYKFKLLSNPPATCSGRAAFRWTQRVFTEKRIILQVSWSANGTRDDDPCRVSGTSAVTFSTSCPEETHIFSPSRQCCVQIQQINIWIWNNNNNNNNNNNENNNENENENGNVQDQNNHQQSNNSNQQSQGQNGSQSQDQSQGQQQGSNNSNDNDNENENNGDDDWEHGDHNGHHHGGSGGRHRCRDDDRDGRCDDEAGWMLFLFFLLLIVAFLLFLCCLCYYESDHVHEEVAVVEPAPQPPPQRYAYLRSLVIGDPGPAVARRRNTTIVM